MAVHETGCGVKSSEPCTCERGWLEGLRREQRHPERKGGTAWSPSPHIEGAGLMSKHQPQHNPEGMF